MFNSDFDPYQQLLQAEANIQQLAGAYNEHQRVLQELRALATHQQEIIQQIVHQNNKLNQISSSQRNELVRLKTEIDLLKLRQ